MARYDATLINPAFIIGPSSVNLVKQIIEYLDGEGHECNVAVSNLSVIVITDSTLSGPVETGLLSVINSHDGPGMAMTYTERRNQLQAAFAPLFQPYNTVYAGNTQNLLDIFRAKMEFDAYYTKPASEGMSNNI